MANRPLIDTAMRGDLEDGVTYAPAMSASIASGAAGAMVVGSGSRSPPGRLILAAAGDPAGGRRSLLRQALDVARKMHGRWSGGRPCA